MRHYFHNSLRALFLSLAVLLSLPMLAVEVEIDGINYDLVAKAKQATVIAKSSGKYSGEVVIPESVEHEGVAYSVTSIGYRVFFDSPGLTSVTIPNSVTSIGGYAFVLCSGLTSVHISDIAAWCNIDFEDYFSNPLSYANHLYLNGEEVKDLVIPNSVTSIGVCAFSGCSGLTSVTIPNSVTSIGEEAFHGCSGLTSVTIPNSVTSIERIAFGDCSGLTSVTIGNSVTSIESEVFRNCSGLTSVTIPDSVTSIGMEAFRGCSGLTSVTIPNSVTSIERNAFSGCSGLTSVTIPNSLTSIESEVFAGCSGLTSVTIPNSVTNIGNYAFRNCSGLTSVTIPNGVTSIGQYAFRDCPELLDVYCYAVEVPTTSSDAFYASNPEYATLHVPAASIDSYKANSSWSGFGTIVAITTEVDGINYDFNAEAKQATVIAKSSGKYSGEIVIPESVVYEGAAYSVTSIGVEAFYKCSGLTSVTIGNSVTSIGSDAFSGCSGLTSVHISDIAAWCNIDFTTYYSNPLYYAHHLYLNGEEVKDLVIPNSVTSIGYGTFIHCSGLTSVTIPNSVTSIGRGAFLGCPDLTSVTIPNSVTSIGQSAFDDCRALTSMTIPNSVTSIGYSAFYYCTSLTSVIIGNSVTSIGNYAFNGCSGLTSVTIPNSVESIGYGAFLSCSGLTSVTIGNSVTSIGEWAFSNCPDLFDVYCYAENVPSTESDAFMDSPIANATLHVPDASIDSYKATAPWSSFGKIVGLSGEEPEVPEVEKCATPMVTYADGKLSFSCETEGAEFITNVVAEDAKKYYDTEIEFSATYNIEVYATKANCENSDTVSVALVWVENGEVNEETGVISVPAAPVLVQGNGGILTVSGVVQNTEVVVYTIDGMEVDRAVASDGTAMIYTGLQSGTIVVVKFGNKSVKVRI